MEDGWIDISTAPPEFLLNDKGQANFNTDFVSALRAQISEVDTK